MKSEVSHDATNLHTYVDVHSQKWSCRGHIKIGGRGTTAILSELDMSAECKTDHVTQCQGK